MRYMLQTVKLSNRVFDLTFCKSFSSNIISNSLAFYLKIKVGRGIRAVIEGPCHYSDFRPIIVESRAITLILAQL